MGRSSVRGRKRAEIHEDDSSELELPGRSLVATAMVVRMAVCDMLPAEALVARAAVAFAQPSDTIVVHETDTNGVPNELYDAAQLYLGTRCLASVSALHLHKTQGASDVVASLPDDHTAWNMFRVVRVLWAS